MQFDKRNYRVSIPILNKFLNKVIYLNRLKIFKTFIKNIKYNKFTKIIDIGTTPIIAKHENILFNLYKFKNNLTGFSNQDCNNLKKKFKKSKFIIGDARKTNLKDNSFDIAFSSATLEHVGNYNNQKKMIKELLRIAKKNVFITTPNRNFLFDFHTKLPLIHLLPKNIHRKILKLLGFKFFSLEDNLNLLNTKELKKILKELKINNYKILYNKFLFLNSNILLLIKK